MALFRDLRHRLKGERKHCCGKGYTIKSVLCGVRVYIVKSIEVASDERSILIGGQGNIACGQAISRLKRRF